MRFKEQSLIGDNNTTSNGFDSAEKIRSELAENFLRLILQLVSRADYFICPMVDILPPSRRCFHPLAGKSFVRHLALLTPDNKNQDLFTRSRRASLSLAAPDLSQSDTLYD